ncbi:MAG: circularly permuted type 2 ATP-grasp protein [Hyphomicrobiaceae bacterium]
MMNASHNTEVQSLAELLSGYAALPGSYDELLAEDGDLRPHWRTYVEAMAGLVARERLGRAARLERLVRETGLVHDIFADPETERAQWRLNLAPLIISAQEWRSLERGLDQRARLFNAILADVYGPQELLRSGQIPPALIFADPAYLRNCHEIAPPGGHLQFYAADLARGPDGQWRVIDSHAETPAGIGYVVANRVMHSEVTNDIFAHCQTRRIAAHFHRQQDALIKRTGTREPNMALLTPGPDHDDYFSHAYLARYLGLHLVEGGDLRVVGDEVFLKTLEGLKPIDGIVRCIEGARSDPLELDPGYFEGPVGLLNACRKAPSLSANALGSAVIENRGLSGYLPALCRSLLGEELILWDTPRWWLGDDIARAHVQTNLESMVVRPAREGTGRPGRAALGRSTSTLSDADREHLKQDMAMYGQKLVAEQPIGFSTMPAQTAQGFRPQAIAVRFYVGGTSDGFSVLPSGVAMAVDSRAAVALSASTGDTHDVWVLQDEPEKPFVSLWTPQLENARVDRAQRALQSRVADNLFWLGRYLERADWTMRVVRSGLGHGRLEYFGTSWSGHASAICLRLLLEKGRPDHAPKHGAKEAQRSLDLAMDLVSSTDGDYSLEQSFSGIYRVASLTRDRLSLEAWRTASVFRDGAQWHRQLQGISVSEIQNEIEDKLAAIATFGGHMHESMTRNYGWFFLDMGRRLERAYNLCDALHALFATPESAESDAERLKYVLDLADSYITYRSRYRVEPMLPLVLDLLLLDETNPRSLAYQLAILTTRLEALPQPNEGTSLPRERRIVLELLTAVRLANLNEMGEVEASGNRERLSRLLQHAQTELPALSDVISRRYFRLVDDEPHRIGMRSEPAQ